MWYSPCKITLLARSSVHGSSTRNPCRWTSSPWYLNIHYVTPKSSSAVMGAVMCDRQTFTAQIRGWSVLRLDPAQCFAPRETPAVVLNQLTGVCGWQPQGWSSVGSGAPERMFRAEGHGETV